LVKRDVIRYADIVIDTTSRRVEAASGPIDLTAREFDLLVTFLREPGRVFTRDQLIDRAWGRDAVVEPSVVETYVSYLRNKLGTDGPRPLIRTIRGVGYTARID
jgi:DNA-binding response OmpR family regulator